MELFDEHIDYGLGMWRYAVWISAGAIFAMAGPVAANLVVNSISGLIPAEQSLPVQVSSAGFTEFLKTHSNPPILSIFLFTVFRNFYYSCMTSSLQ
jgi:hypothetical protein